MAVKKEIRLTAEELQKRIQKKKDENGGWLKAPKGHTAMDRITEQYGRQEDGSILRGTAMNGIRLYTPKDAQDFSGKESASVGYDRRTGRADVNTAGGEQAAETYGPPAAVTGKQLQGVQGLEWYGPQPEDKRYEFPKIGMPEIAGTYQQNGSAAEDAAELLLGKKNENTKEASSNEGAASASGEKKDLPTMREFAKTMGGMEGMPMPTAEEAAEALLKGGYRGRPSAYIDKDGVRHEYMAGAPHTPGYVRLDQETAGPQLPGAEPSGRVAYDAGFGLMDQSAKIVDGRQARMTMPGEYFDPEQYMGAMDAVEAWGRAKDALDKQTAKREKAIAELGSEAKYYELYGSDRDLMWNLQATADEAREKAKEAAAYLGYDLDNETDEKIVRQYARGDYAGRLAAGAKYSEAGAEMIAAQDEANNALLKQYGNGGDWRSREGYETLLSRVGANNMTGLDGKPMKAQEIAMTQEQRANYASMLAYDRENGTNYAGEWLEKNNAALAMQEAERRENVRQWQREETRERLKDSPWLWLAVAADNQVLDSAASVISNTVIAPAEGIAMLGRQQLTGDLGVNFSLSATAAQGRKMRQNVSQGIRENVGGFWGEALGFTYDSTMSILDNLANVAVYGGMSGKVGEYATLASMSLGVAGSTFTENLASGMDPDTAFLSAIGQGVNEALFEKLSLEHFIEMSNGHDVTNWAKNFIKSGLIESSEEGFTETANLLWTNFTEGENSEFNRTKAAAAAAAMAQDPTLTPEQAEKIGYGQAMKAFGMNLVMACAGGFFSGTVMSGVAGAINNHKYHQIQALQEAAMNEAERKLRGEASTEAVDISAEGNETANQGMTPQAQPADLGAAFSGLDEAGRLMGDNPLSAGAVGTTADEALRAAESQTDAETLSAAAQEERARIMSEAETEAQRSRDAAEAERVRAMEEAQAERARIMQEAETEAAAAREEEQNDVLRRAADEVAGISSEGLSEDAQARAAELRAMEEEEAARIAAEQEEENAKRADIASRAEEEAAQARQEEENARRADIASRAEEEAAQARQEEENEKRADISQRAEEEAESARRTEEERKAAEGAQEAAVSGKKGGVLDGMSQADIEELAKAETARREADAKAKQAEEAVKAAKKAAQEMRKAGAEAWQAFRADMDVRQAETAAENAQNEARKLGDASDSLAADMIAEKKGKVSVRELQKRYDEEHEQRLSEAHAVNAIGEGGVRGAVGTLAGATVQNGRLTWILEDREGNREYVDAADAEFHNQQDADLMSAKGAQDLSPAAAVAYLENYSPKVNGREVSVDEYLSGFQDMAAYGEAGLSQQEAVQASARAQVMLTDKARTAAYQAGLAMRTRAQVVENQKAEADQKFEKAEEEKKENAPYGTLEEKEAAQRRAAQNRQKGDAKQLHREYTGELNEEQHRHVSVVSALARHFKTQVHVVDSLGGRRGMYKGGEIYVALDAKGGALEYVTMHEMVHKLRAESTSKAWTHFADVVKNAYEKYGTTSFDELRKEVREGYEKQGIELVKDGDLEEVVCSAASVVLEHSEVLEQLYRENRGMFAQIRNFMNDLVDNVLLTGLKLGSESGYYRMLTDMPEMEDVKKIWEEMNRIWEENEGKEKVDDGRFYFSANEQEFKNAENLTREDAKDVLNRCINKGREDYIGWRGIYAPIRANTPQFLAGKMGSDLAPMMSNVSKINQALTDENEIAENGRRGHGFTEEELLSVYENMNYPKMIGLQENGRYAVAVGFKGSKGQYCIAIIKKGYDVNQNQTEGYRPGKYNIVVTEYKKETIKNVYKYFDKNMVEIPYDERKDPKPQRSGQSDAFSSGVESSSKTIAQPEEEVKYSLEDSEKDSAYMAAVESGDTATQERMVDEAAKEAGYTEKLYHGTPYGGFTVFRDWGYFSPSKEYADRYHHPGASSIRGKYAEATKPTTYEVYVKPGKVFDTRNAAEKAIFMSEFYRKWGNGAPLQESGLPDWTDGSDLIEFFEENGYDYDSIMLDEGGDGGYGEEVTKRGYSLLVKDSSQVKSADPVTYDDNGDVIPLSERFNTEKSDIRWSLRDDNADLQTAGDALEQALDNVKAHRINAVEADAIAAEVLKATSSTYDRGQLAIEIANLFDYAERGEGLDMAQFSRMQNEILQRVLEQSHMLDAEHEVEYAGVRNAMKQTAIVLTEEDRKEIIDRYGSIGAFKRELGSTVRFTTDTRKGDTLDGWWQQMSELYPWQFDAETRRGDMADELVRIAQVAGKQYVDGMSAYDMAEAVEVFAETMNTAYLSQPGVKQAAKNARKLGMSLQAYRDAQLQFQNSTSEEFQNTLWGLMEMRTDAENGSRARTQGTNTELNITEEERQARMEAGRQSAEGMIGSLSEFEQAIREKYRKKAEDSIKRRRDSEIRSKAQASIERTAVTLSNWMAQPTQTHHVPEEMMGTLGRIIGALDFTGKDTQGAQRARNVIGANLAQLGHDTGKVLDENGVEHGVTLSANLKELADQLAQNLQDMTDEGLGARIEVDQELVDRLNDLAKRMEGKSVYTLDAKDMADVAKWMQAVKHVVTKAGKIMGSGLKGMTLEEAAGASVAEMSQKRAWKDRSALAKAYFNTLGIDQMDSFSYFESLGGTATSLFRELREGFDDHVRNIQETMEYTLGEQGVLKKVNVKELSNQKIDFALESGETVQITKAQAMELWCLGFREQAQGHIYEGGVRFDGDEDAHPRKITKGDMANIERMLTAEEKAAAQALQRFMAVNCARWGNRTAMTLYGYRKFGETGYYPIRTDSNSNRTGKLDEESAIASINAIKNSGFTKDLKKGAKNALVVGDIFDTFTRHVSQMSAYNSYAVAMSDMGRWMNMEGVRTEIEQLWGTKGKKYLTEFLKAINGTTGKSMETGLTGAVQKLTGAYKASAVGANLSVAIQQPTSYARAAMMISPKYLAQGMKVAEKGTTELIDKYVGIAQWKHWGFFETDVGRGLKSMLTGDETFREKLTDRSMKLAEAGDNWTLRRLWTAVEAETKELYPELMEGTERYYEHIGRRVSDIVDRTQVVDSVFHRSQIMRSKNALANMMTAFMAEPTKSYNMIQNSILNYAENRDSKTARQNVARAMCVFAANTVLTGAAQAIIAAMRDRDDKDWWEKYLKAFAGYDTTEKNTAKQIGNVLMNGNISPVGEILGDIPGVKDVYGMIAAKWFGGYTNTDRMDLQSISRLLDGAEDLYKAGKALITGETDGATSIYGYIYKASNGISTVTGIPVYGLLRDLNAIIDTAVGDDITRNGDYNASGTVDSLYAAMLKGDGAKEDKLRGKLRNDFNRSNAEVSRALGKILAEDDPRVKKAFDLYEEGRVEAGKAIENEVLAEGVFDEETIQYALSTFTPKEPDEKDLDKELDVTEFEAKRVAEFILGSIGLNEKKSTEADVMEAMAEMGKDYGDPGGSVATQLKKNYKELISGGNFRDAAKVGESILRYGGKEEKYLMDAAKEALSEAMGAGDTKTAKSIEEWMQNSLGADEGDVNAAKKTVYRDRAVEAAGAGDAKTLRENVKAMRDLGYTDAEIHTAMKGSAQKVWKDLDAKGRKAMEEALRGLGLKNKKGGKYFDDFSDWK